MFAISADDRGLVAGPPGERRSFLDRFCFLLEPRYFDELRGYRKLLAQRNAALDRGTIAWPRRLREQYRAALTPSTFFVMPSPTPMRRSGDRRSPRRV